VRELALGVIDVGIIAGLAWSLWFVFAHGRRERRRTEEQLAAPLAKTDSMVVIRPNLKASVFYALFFGWLTLGTVAKAGEDTAGGGSVTLALVAVLLGALAVYYGRRALLRRPVLAIDGRGMTVGSAAAVPWGDVYHVEVVAYRTVVGVTQHRLVFDIAGEDSTGIDQRTIQLEMLSLPWDEIVIAVQNRMGRRVAMPGKAGGRSAPGSA
jgi:hypothetical protein